MLQGKKVYLRCITIEDTQNIINWRNKKYVRDNFIYRELFTKESHEKWMQEMVYTGKVKQFIIVEKEKNISIGSTYLRDIDNEHLKAEYGIFIGDENSLGKGYGSEVAELMCDFAFKELKLNKVFLRVFAENKRAIRSYQKAGFQEEGCFKKDIRIENEYHDIVFMAKFNN